MTGLRIDLDPEALHELAAALVPLVAAQISAGAVELHDGRLAVTAKEAARRLGISTSTFYETVRPELKAVPNVGRGDLYPVAELERWLRLRARRLEG
jgi:hypothetical protein